MTAAMASAAQAMQATNARRAFRLKPNVLLMSISS